MTQEEKRITIAEACGWSSCQRVYDDPMGRPPNTSDRLVIIPDYFGCLNAMHEAEKHCLTNGKLEEAYYFAIDRNHYATAAQRAEALGLTLGLWTA